MTNAMEAWSKLRDFIHDLGACKPRLIVSHAIHQIDEDVGVETCARNGDRCANSLNTTFGVAERAFFFRITATRKNNIGELGRFC